MAPPAGIMASWQLKTPRKGTLVPGEGFGAAHTPRPPGLRVTSDNSLVTAEVICGLPQMGARRPDACIK
jgi:hypothetical protein